jgi:hypothetical protein
MDMTICKKDLWLFWKESKLPLLRLFFDYASKLTHKKHTGSKFITA